MRRGARLVTGGTDNHLVLLDVRSFGLTGRQAESALLDAGIVTNRNSIPRDPNGAWYTSRRPPRHAGAHVPRLRRRRLRPGRRADRRRALRRRRRPPRRAGQPSQAKYAVADGVAEETQAAAAELLDAHPLYPGPRPRLTPGREAASTGPSDNPQVAFRGRSGLPPKIAGTPGEPARAIRREAGRGDGRDGRASDGRAQAARDQSAILSQGRGRRLRRDSFGSLVPFVPRGRHRELDHHREPAAGHRSRGVVPDQGLARRQHRGIRRRLQRQRRRDGPLQGQDRRGELGDADLSARLVRRARRPEGRRVGRPPARSRSRHRFSTAVRVSSIAATGRRRRPGRFRAALCRACTSPSSSDSTAGLRTRRGSSSATTRGRPTSSCRHPTRRGRPTTSGEAPASTASSAAPRRRRGARRQAELRPAVPAHGAGAQLLLGGVPARPLARAQRLRRVVHRRTRRPSQRLAVAVTKGRRVIGPRRVLVGHPAHELRGRARCRRLSHLHVRQRGVLEDSVGAEHRDPQVRTRRSFVTRRPRTAPRPTRVPPGPARGGTSGSARRRTAAVPRTS